MVDCTQGSFIFFITRELKFKYFRVARKYQIFIRLVILIFLISVIRTDFFKVPNLILLFQSEALILKLKLLIQLKIENLMMVPPTPHVAIIAILHLNRNRRSRTIPITNHVVAIMLLSNRLFNKSIMKSPKIVKHSKKLLTQNTLAMVL